MNKEKDMQKEYSLMVILARTFVSECLKVRAEKIIKDRKVSWANFLYLCIHHRVMPLVYYNLKKLELLAYVENHIRRIFEYVSRSICSHNEIIMKEVNRISNKFIESGVKGVILKGGNIAATLYKNIALRQFGDIDILIAPRDVSLVENIMRDLKYTQGKIDINNGEIIEYSREECMFRKINSHEIAEFVKKNNEEHCPYYLVDINFSIIWKGFKGENSAYIDLTEDMLNHSVLYHNTNYKFFTLNCYNQLIQLCCHLFSEAVYFCWHTNWKRDKSDLNLVKFCDIHELLLDSKINWQNFLAYVDKIVLVKPVYYSLYLVNHIFQDFYIPYEIISYVEDTNLINMFYDTNGNIQYWEILFDDRMIYIDEKCKYIENLGIL